MQNWPAVPTTSIPTGRPAPSLPPRASSARICLFVASPLAFLTVVAFAGRNQTATAELAAPALVTGAVLVVVAMRTRNDHMPATATGASGIRLWSRWDWTDIVAFLPATLGAGAVTATVILGLTQAADQQLSAAARSAVESFAAQAAFYVAALIALAVLLLLRRGLRIPALGWRVPRALGRSWLPWLGVALVTAVLTLIVANLLAAVSAGLLPNAPNTQCTTVRQQYGGYVGVAIPLVCLIAPIAEETIFRGFFYGWLRRHLPVAPAVLLSAAVFAVSHAVLVLTLPLFGVGVILALLYEYSESLVPGAMVHGLFNLVGILAILGSTTTC